MGHPLDGGLTPCPCPLVAARRGGRPHTGGVGCYGDHILPRLTHLAMRGREFAALRARVAAGLAGDVLEIGFGSGLNVPCYPAGLRRVWVVDPAAVGFRLAAKRVAASAIPIEYAGADAQALPLGDASVDHVLSTWTLCTIPDPARALLEIRRVLRPGGTLHFVEHGRSPDEKVVRAQNRLTPLQRRIAGGCHLNRPIGLLITGAGLEVTRMDNYYLTGPRPFVYTFEGVAVRAAGPTGH
jgi:SAM-dependent methyltransferase